MVVKNDISFWYFPELDSHLLCQAANAAVGHDASPGELAKMDSAESCVR